MSYKLIKEVIGLYPFQVYKIENVCYRKRLFCILDPNLPYVLSFDYKEFDKKNWYNFRMNEVQCKIHFDRINDKQKIIEHMLSEYNDIKYEEHNRKMLQKTIKAMKNF